MMERRFKIKNVKGFAPFDVIYRDLTDDVIEVDVSGRAILRENQEQTASRLAEMWIIYDDLSQHSSNDIGIHYELRPGSLLKKKTMRHPGIEDAFIKLFVTYKKPFKESPYSFQPTTNLIITNILDSIFVIPTF